MIELQRNTSDFNKKKPSVKELTHLFYLEFTKEFCHSEAFTLWWRSQNF